MIIGVTGSLSQRNHIAMVSSLLREAVSEGCRIAVEKDFGAYLAEMGVMPAPGLENMERLPDDTSLVLSFGGDGTFLRAACWAGDSGVPILGINTGHLGFLATFSPDDMGKLRRVLRAEDVVTEKRMLLQVRADGLPDDFYPYALNEVSVIKADTASMISVEAHIDGDFLADYLCDGLLVSTPTGSTAYNLSVGGPLLQPTLNCMVVSPIAPHSLTMRPLVVDGNSVLCLRASSRVDSFRLSLDGRSIVTGCGKSIEISAAPFRVTMLRLREDTFPRLLRGKLLWSRR